jgi:hypothetical protein
MQIGLQGCGNECDSAGCHGPGLSEEAAEKASRLRENEPTALSGTRSVSGDLRFWSSGDTNTGPPDDLLMGA